MECSTTIATTTARTEHLQLHKKNPLTWQQEPLQKNINTAMIMVISNQDDENKTTTTTTTDTRIYEQDNYKTMERL